MNELNFERKMATIFKKRILISAIMSVMVLTAIADEYTDPQTNVVYTYEPGQSTASVKAGYYGGTGMNIDLCPGSPDAAGDVVILDKFTVGTAEYVVTSIGESAFWYNKNIKSVNIPESVTDIGVEAFKCCDGLTAVQLPEGLKRIPREIFLDCRKLESVGIPSSVRAIDEQAFSNCISLASLNLPAGLNYIGRYAFQNTPWYSTQYNEAPNGLFYIGPLLVGYKGDVPTGELVIKEGTTCIGYQAFNYCTGLTSVTIPKSLTHVDYRAFYNCVGLTAVHITDLAAWCKIEFQWDDASCSSNPLFNAHHLYLNGEEVTDLVIPDGVTSIGRYSFDNCTGLTSVTIPEGVTRICSNAFRSCSNLTSVTIPPSVTIIESMPFLWCKNLAVHISDLAAWCSISFQAASDVFYHDARLYLNGEEVKDLVIPDGVASIGSWSFMNCSYLTSVTIPESVTKIGEAAFYECSSLTDVYCYADNVPTTRYDAFKENLIATATLHVPAGSIDLYKTTSPWSEFGNIVEIPLVTFTKGQVATIILPITPDADKGRYFRLDRWEDDKIILEEEPQPQARTPYVIIPNEDFIIDPSTIDLEGLSHDTVSIEGISFIGTYIHNEFNYQEEFYIDIIDTTPDCLNDWFGSGKAIVGALRAYLTVNWDDPISQDGTRGPKEKMEIVLKDHGTGINEIQDSKSKIQNEGAIFDLQGRRISSKPARGIYIRNGRKVVIK